ncbi:methyl-accepting chemotaxis protein [Xylanibacillus composti]|nr:methyl-accepting chemotaxis protein [Xylanibacillus composti]
MKLWKQLTQRIASVSRPDKKALPSSSNPHQTERERKSKPIHNAPKGKRTFSLNPARSVGAKLFILFFVSTIILVSISGFSSYLMSKDTITDQVSEFSRQAIVQAKEKMDLVLGKYTELSLQFLTDAEIQTTISNIHRGTDDNFAMYEMKSSLDNKLNGMTMSNNELHSIFYFDTNGNTISSGGSVTAANAGGIAEKEWFQHALETGDVIWLNTMVGGVMGNSQEATFGLARLIRTTSTNTDTGVLMIEIKASAFRQHLANLQLGDSGVKYIMNENNELIYSENQELIGTVLEDIELAREDGEVVTRPYSYENHGNLIIHDKFRAANNDWFLVGSVPIAELTEDANRILMATTFIIGAAVLVAVGVGYIMVRLIARPLVSLRNLMNEGEQGNLSVRTSIRSKDEIGQLGESFNRMMEQISLLVKQTNQSALDVLETATELSNVSKQTAISSREISMATEQIASGASTLAMEAEKGNGITIELGEQMGRVVEANMEMGKAAHNVRGVSEQGTGTMTELIGKTEQTERMTRSMVEKVDKLKESTDSIRKILDMLNAIAKQTNILSLNATIEAARAGTAGKGFMVVADEIRKLADQSRQSIDVVGQITDTIQAEIGETVDVLSDAYPIFQEQIASVKDTDKLFSTVKVEMESFISKLDDVTQSLQTLESSQMTLSEAMSSVSAVSQESSATSEQVASLSNQQLSSSEGLVQMAEKLENLSKSLQQTLQRFQIEG